MIAARSTTLTRLGMAGAAAATGWALALVAAPPAAADEEHRVAPGDTVWDLAQRYGSSVDAIVAANALDARSTIVTGSTLVIPTEAAPAPTAAAVPAGTRVVVTAGDTVWGLAHAHGTTVAAIVDANGLNSRATIRTGQELSIPGSTASTPAATAATPSSPAPTGTLVTVAPGDSLSGIASRHGTTVGALAAANGIANPSLIRIGQVITVPGATPAPTGLVSDTFLGRTYPADVVASANRHKAELLGRDVPSRDQMRQLVIATAQALGVDPALAQAVAYQESGFNMRAVSSADAVGVMQVIPASGEWASQLAGRPLDLLDPQDNVTAGVIILRTHLRELATRDEAIGAYYQGAAAVRRHGLYPGTVTYVASVNALIPRFG